MNVTYVNVELKNEDKEQQGNISSQSDEFNSTLAL